MSWLRSLVGDTSHLIKELGDDDWKKQNAARDALVAMRPDRTLEPLVRALADQNPEVRKKVAEVLGLLGDPRATEALLASLKSDDEDLRKEAVIALGMIDDDRATDALFDAVARDPNQAVRSRGLTGLAKRPTPRVIEAVIAAASDAHCVVWEEAFRVIATFDREQLDAFGPRLLSAAISALKKPDGNFGKYVCKALGHFGDVKAVPALVAQLNEEKNSGTRSYICEALGALRAADAVDAIVARGLSWDRCRESAARALAEIGDGRAIAPLCEALKSENDDRIRDAIRKALEKLGAHALAEAAATQKKPLDVARDPASSSPSLEALVDSNDLDVVMALATNPSTPPAVLRQLNKKWYSYPRSPRFLWGHFINNRNCPSDILGEIARNTDNPHTEKAVRQHANFLIR